MNLIAPIEAVEFSFPLILITPYLASVPSPVISKTLTLAVLLLNDGLSNPPVTI